MSRASELLQQLGLSRNESRAYTALLSCQPASGYEIARQSGIPSSKIYEAVNKLVARGVLQPVGSDQEQGTRYVALPPEDLVTRIRETAVAQTSELLPLLEAIGEPASTDFIWPIPDVAQICTRGLEMIDTSQHSILVSAWPQELTWMERALRSALERGVRVALVHFGPPRVEIGATYHHPVEKTLYREKGGRGLTLVVDSDAVLIANFREDGQVDAAWSKNQGFVTVAEDYVKHDVYITKVTRFLDDAMIERFGPEYEKLRDVFDADA